MIVKQKMEQMREMETQLTERLQLFARWQRELDELEKKPAPTRG